MDVIFLDIDGVLNSECFFVMRARNMRGLRLMDVDDGIDKSVQNRMYCIDPRNLDVLMELIEETKSKVVITSIWKFLKSFEGVCKELKSFGVPIIGQTSDNFFNRGYGIKKYLNNNDVNNFVILDDINFIDYDRFLQPNFVKTNFRDGLTETEKVKALKILRK